MIFWHLQIEKSINLHILALRESVCKSIQWLRFVSEDLTGWILVWMTINRIAAITWVTRLRFLTTLRTTCIALGTIFLYSLFANTYCFWLFSIRSRPKVSQITGTNETYYSCSTYKAARSKNTGKIIMIMFGYIEPIFPITVLLILSIFLGIRLIIVASKRRELLSRKKSSNLISTIRNPQNTHNESVRRLDQKGIQREFQLALVIIAFSVAEILIEGSSSILSAILAVMSRVLKDPALNYRYKLLKQIDFYFQDASILLRIWNLFAYLIIMPSFRQAIMDCVFTTKIWKNK